MKQLSLIARKGLQVLSTSLKNSQNKQLPWVYPNYFLCGWFPNIILLYKNCKILSLELPVIKTCISFLDVITLVITSRKKENVVFIYFMLNIQVHNFVFTESQAISNVSFAKKKKKVHCNINSLDKAMH